VTGQAEAVDLADLGDHEHGDVAADAAFCPLLSTLSGVARHRTRAGDSS
jgi:hypothetical protein